MKCSCYLRNVQDFLSDGKTPHEMAIRRPTCRKHILSERSQLLHTRLHACTKLLMDDFKSRTSHDCNRVPASSSSNCAGGISPPPGRSMSTKSQVSCTHARWVSRHDGFPRALACLTTTLQCSFSSRGCWSRAGGTSRSLRKLQILSSKCTGNSLAEPGFHTISPDRIHCLQPNGPLSGNETFCAQIEVVASWNCHCFPPALASTFLLLDV